MAIPIHEMQATGEYKVPGLHQPVTGYHVREAVKLLGTRDRVAVQQYLARGGKGNLPPAPTLAALRSAVEETVLNGKRATPEGAAHSTQ